jgi:tRNA threonylcarbamoyladenosine biosynthesis protein TsaE
MPVWRTHSAAETVRLGRRIGRALPPGSVVALSGGLGAGKTTLARGIARGLGVAESAVSSPTFTLLHEYAGRRKVYHMDWYRLRRLSGRDAQEVAECFDGASTALVEWPERGTAALPKERFVARLRHAGADSRIVSLTARGPKSRRWLAAFERGEKMR